MRVAFLTTEPEHAPWAETIRRHAERLDATVVLVGGVPWPGSDAVAIDELDAEFDVACAFGWKAATELFRPRARGYAYLAPALEDGLMWAGDEMRLLATLSYDLPARLIVQWEAAAVALRERTGRDVAVVRPGVPGMEGVTPRQAGDTAEAGSASASGRPLRLLVTDAQPGFATEIVRRMEAPVEARFMAGLHADEGVFDAGAPVDGTELADRARAYAGADVVLELPRPEAPLRAAVEAMHAGVPAVVTPCLGHAEAVTDHESALVVDWDDVPGAAHALDRLARDTALRERLAAGARDRAAAWPSEDDAVEALRTALEQALEHEPGDWPRRLVLNARAAVEGVKRERHALEVALRRNEGEMVTNRAAMRVGLALRPLWRPLLPLIRLLRGRRG